MMRRIDRKGMDRKGISPLIATVLLLAFAVALSTMVVSYVLKATKSTPCDHAGLGVDEAQPACYTDGHIDFILVNKGQTPTTAVKVRLTALNRDIQEVQLAAALDPGSAMKASIPYNTINPGSVTLTLVPVVKDNGGEIFCVEQETRVPLRTC